MKLTWHFSTLTCLPGAPTGESVNVAIDGRCDPEYDVDLCEIKVCTRTFTPTSLCRKTAKPPEYTPATLIESDRDIMSRW
jgi:hypothetical protein